MPSFNSWTLMGNLCRDPEIKHLASGTAVCEFSLAVNYRKKVNEEWVDEVDYFDCVAWGRFAAVFPARFSLVTTSVAELAAIEVRNLAKAAAVNM